MEGVKCTIFLFQSRDVSTQWVFESNGAVMTKVTALTRVCFSLRTPEIFICYDVHIDPQLIPTVSVLS